LNLESLQCALQTILGAQDDLIPPDIRQEEVKKETIQEEESSPNIFGHLSIASSKPTSRLFTLTTLGVRWQTNLLLKTLQLYLQSHLNQLKLEQSNAGPKLDYDVVEDLKKLRANISIYELLKFPFLLQKMLQNISENGKNGNSNNNKVVQSKVPLKTSTNNPDSQDKGSLPITSVNKNVNNNVNSVNNSDKVALETQVRNHKLPL
jgi:hypothetical protein